MLDLFSYFIYISLLLIVTFLTFFAINKKDKLNFTEVQNLTKYHILALLIISFVVGFRYYVGNDWEGYRIHFEYLRTYNYMLYKMEWGFLAINKIISGLGGNYTLMFFTVALISWYFIFKSVPFVLLPLTLFFLFTDEFFFWSMNGVRQFVAMAIFLYSIKFIINHNMGKYFLMVGLAALFHISALFLIPLYFIPFQKLYNQKIWFIAFILSFFFANISYITDSLQILFLKLSSYIPLLSIYLRYFEEGKYQAADITVGLGYYFRVLITLLIFYYSKDAIEKYPKTKIYFILFFMSAIIFNLFFMFSLIGRLNNYFIIIRTIVLALIIYHLWVNRKYRILPIGIAVLYFFLFLVTIYNSSNMCSPFRFTFM